MSEQERDNLEEFVADSTPMSDYLQDRFSEEDELIEEDEENIEIDTPNVVREGEQLSHESEEQEIEIDDQNETEGVRTEEEDTDRQENEQTETEPDQTTEVTDEIATPMWSVPLATLGEEPLRLVDFQNEYLYQRVKTPTNVDTDKFLVFHRESADVNWKVLNGLLTDRYVVVDLEQFITDFTSQINIPVIDTNVKTMPFNAIWKGTLEDTEIDYFDNDEAAKTVFSIISGLETERLDELGKAIVLNLSNSYDGTKTMRLDYTVRLSAKVVSENTTQEFEFSDLFTLTKYSNRSIHNQGITEVLPELSEIRNSTIETINQLKLIDTGINDKIETLSKCFRKENKEVFVGYCDNLAAAYKNLYYVLIVASYVLSSNYTINEHYSARRISDKLIGSL